MYILAAFICKLFLLSRFNRCVCNSDNVFFALYQALKILSYIDKNKAFSESSVKALKYIKYCAVTISIIYAGLIPLLFPIADADDAPGLIGFPIIIIFASIVIAVFAAVLQKLLQEAIDIKSENDLTV